MPNCLGIYIESNIIKYAKVSKEKENIKIESFGVKTYDNLNKAIKQIIEETYSFKTPISVNITKEKYNYFNMFSLLNKKDLQKAIDIEFETYCVENKINAKALETRYAAVNSKEDKERLKIIHLSANKIDVADLKQKFEGNKLINISPISIAIPNVIQAKTKENALIVNIEEETTVTTIYNQEIYNITKIEEGSKTILDKINEKENSYSKAYDICKNTTIYTSEVQEFVETENTYLEDIMPTLYNIVGKIQKILNESFEKIEKIYITGTGANINNIDLYFQEYLGDIKCEILKPYFVQNVSRDFNIKDYIEVNSATALAMQGLGLGVSGMNFKSPSIMDRIPEVNIKLSSKKTDTNSKKEFTNIFVNDFRGTFTKVEMALLRGILSVLLFIVIYAVFSRMISNQINDKIAETNSRTQQISAEISKIQSDTSTLNKRTSEYSALLTQMKTANDKTQNIAKSKNDIPNLLNRIMFIIPENVQITSIKNTSDRNITIEAQAINYEELGYFKVKLKTDNVLNNVTATSGIKQDGVIKITIEGELP